YLRRATDEHLSTEPLRRARDWLDAHFDSPLAGLPTDDPTLVAAGARNVLPPGEEGGFPHGRALGVPQRGPPPAGAPARPAARNEEFELQRELLTQREQLREQLDELMGQEA